MVGTHRLKIMEKYVPSHLERVTMVTKHRSLFEGTKDFHSRLLWMYNNPHYRSERVGEIEPGGAVNLSWAIRWFFKGAIPSSQPLPQDLSFRNNNNNDIII